MDIPLGKQVKQPSKYAPEALAALPRALARDKSGIDAGAFIGLDRWTAYEFAWLDSEGRIHPGTLDIEIAPSSKNIVESKSLKLYLNSCYYARFSGLEEVRSELSKTLGQCVEGAVKVNLLPLADSNNLLAITDPVGQCIDQAKLDTETSLAIESEVIVHEQLYSQVFEVCVRSPHSLIGQRF